MALFDVTIPNAKPGNKQQKLYGGGALLLVTPSGSKRWIFKYRFAGKEKSLALGVYPDVPLADGPQAARRRPRKLAANIDPGEAKKADKRAARLAAANSFEAVSSRGWGSAASQLRLASMKRRWRVLRMTSFFGLASVSLSRLRRPKY
ncbi:MULTISPECIES: Arm DNA-binding domain-containing protein [unclassified Paraburkholderia]|jgi:hypothetical protein|uniref:Arm DNA-binding domain-containing protein n=1 Tax=unclassified Paraburkholderia TaxID=2615204 RepID=UPI0038B6D1B7